MTIKEIFALVMAFLCGLPGSLGAFPSRPRGPAVDMGRFASAPVWADEFDGDALDPAKWHLAYGPQVRGGWWSLDMCEVKDGSLTIQTAYQAEGLDGLPPGYYSCGISTQGLFEQAHGYFEARCILPRGTGQWSAFWMNCDGMSGVDDSGRDGAEIDIMESPYYFLPGCLGKLISSNVHVDGYGGDLKSRNTARAIVPGDPYREFHTYGLEWNENEYIFYVDGIQTGKSSFKGTSLVPEFLLLSVEVSGENGVPAKKFFWGGDLKKNKELPSAFVIDYVRVWAYK